MKVILLLSLPLLLIGCQERGHLREQKEIAGHLREQRAIEDLGASRMYGDWVDIESGTKGGYAEEPLKPGQRIVELSLNSHRELRDEQLKALESLPHLTYLQLDHTNISDKGAAHVRFCKKLRKLTLREVSITDRSVDVFSQLTALRELDLWGTNITDEGLMSLVQLPNLESLTLHETSVSDQGVALFYGKASLKEIGLGKTHVTIQAKEKLRESIPGISIWPDDAPSGETESTQQDGADQPATAPESKAEGYSQPQTKSEVRPQ